MQLDGGGHRLAHRDFVQGHPKGRDSGDPRGVTDGTRARQRPHSSVQGTAPLRSTRRAGRRARSSVPPSAVNHSPGLC